MDNRYSGKQRLTLGSTQGSLGTRFLSRPRARLLVMSAAQTDRPNHRPAESAGPDMTRLPVHSALGSALRVLLVDDHRQLRQGLRGLVDGFPGIEVVGEACDGEQAVILAQQLQPDVILMDVQLPRLNGYDATRLICAQQSAPAVIGLSVGHIPQVEAGMLSAGARAYLCKEDAADRLYDLIRAICPRRQPALLS